MMRGLFLEPPPPPPFFRVACHSEPRALVQLVRLVRLVRLVQLVWFALVFLVFLVFLTENAWHFAQFKKTSAKTPGHLGLLDGRLIAKALRFVGHAARTNERASRSPEPGTFGCR
jgi:hypothetical protein